MTIDRDPMGSTMIRIDNETHDMLDSVKVIPQEPYNDCVKRLIRENQRFKKIYFTTQTREKMQDEIKNFVLNPDIKIDLGNHRQIWLDAHPGEIIGPNDHIHHINGNHNDNRPENLQKVNASEHRKAHAKMVKDAGGDYN